MTMRPLTRAEAFRERIQRGLRMTGLTRQQAGDLLGVKDFYNVLNGNRIPSPETATKVAELFGYSRSELYSGEFPADFEPVKEGAA